MEHFNFNPNDLLYLSFFFLAVSFYPFFTKIINSRSAQGVSQWMLILGSFQGVLFFIYNIYFDRTLMAFNFLLLFALFFLGYLATNFYKKKGDHG